MFKKIILILSMLVISLFVSSAYADTIVENDNVDLILKISNIKNQKGTIRVAIFNSEDDYRKSGYNGSNAYKKVNAKIDAIGQIRVIFKGIPSGIYAVKLFQDEDGSGVLKAGYWEGKPKEDFGFSNNIDAKSGEPDFNQVKFKLDKAHLTQEIKMQRALAS